MKKMSLTVKMLLTDGVSGAYFILLGVSALMEKMSNFPKAVLIAGIVLALGLLVFTSVVRRNWKFDVWDETAKEHFSYAREIVFEFTRGLIAGVACGLLIGVELLKVNLAIFQLSGWHLIIIYGITELALAITFAVLEKRDA